MSNNVRPGLSELPIFFINLDDATDRARYMQSQLTGLGLDGQVRRVPAQDARSGSMPNAYKWTLVTRQWSLSRGEIACIESHRTACRQFLETGAPMGVILEDDVVFSPRFSEALADLVTSVPVFDVVKLDGVTAKLRLDAPFDCSGVTLRALECRAFSSAAYLISRRGAERFLDETRTYSYPMDLFLFMPRKGWEQFQADPAICAQGMLLSANDVQHCPESVKASERREGAYWEDTHRHVPLWFKAKIALQNLWIELPYLLWRDRAMLRRGGKFKRPDLLDNFASYIR